MPRFRLLKPDREGFCKILAKNVEDFKRLGYDKDAEFLKKIYEKVCS